LLDSLLQENEMKNSLVVLRLNDPPGK